MLSERNVYVYVQEAFVMKSTPILVQVQHLKTTCASCSVLELCLPLGLTEIEVGRLDTLIPQRVKVKKGASLYRTADPLRSLYAVRTGFFKTCVATEDGRDQVTGFQMAGEIIGRGKHLQRPGDIENLHVGKREDVNGFGHLA